MFIIGYFLTGLALAWIVMYYSTAEIRIMQIIGGIIFSVAYFIIHTNNKISKAKKD